MTLSCPSRPRLAACLLALALAGCNSLSPTPPPATRVFDSERFDNAAPYSRAFAFNPAAACQAARRALLSQGYMLYMEEAARLHGRKFFRPANGQVVELAINVVCLPGTAAGSTGAVVFATAWQDAFITKRNPVAASVGMPVLGNLSMPVASTEDSLIKVGVETVQDPDYYARFFTLLQDTAQP